MFRVTRKVPLRTFVCKCVHYILYVGTIWIVIAHVLVWTILISTALCEHSLIAIFNT